METLIDSNSHQITEPFTPVHTLCEAQVNQNRASMTTPRCGICCDVGSTDIGPTAPRRRVYITLPLTGRGVCRAAGFKVTSKLIITVTSHAGASHVRSCGARKETSASFQSDRLISWRAPLSACFLPPKDLRRSFLCQMIKSQSHSVCW